MTSKRMALRVLDCLFIAVTVLLILSVAGLPMEWLCSLLDMSARGVRALALFLVFASLWVMHAIVTSDSAP